MKETILKNFINYQINTLGLLITKKITQSKILNKPWAIVDGDFEIQKLIFESDGKLILSKNGIVQEGKWVYYPEANSFMIDRKSNKILCNLLYCDDAAIILKLDGTKNEFFAFANENILPSLNLLDYLNQKILQQHEIKEIPLNNGRILNIYFDSGTNVHFDFETTDYIIKDVPVTYKNSESVDNGFHFSSDYKYLYVIQNGKIQSRLSTTKLTLINKEQIFFIRDKYVFNADGSPISGVLELNDNLTKIDCNNGNIIEVYYIKEYRIQNNGTLILKQKDKDRIQLKDKVVKYIDVNDKNEYWISFNKITINNNEVIHIDDTTVTIFLIVALIVLLSILLIIVLTSNS